MGPRQGPQYPAQASPLSQTLTSQGSQGGKSAAGLASHRNQTAPAAQQRVLSSRSPRHTPRPGGGACGDVLQPDAAQQRVLRTPRVFQSNKEHFSSRKQRELRANLLPSILWTPVDGSRPQDTQEQLARKTVTNGSTAPSNTNGESITGEYHSKYQEVLEQRARAEEAVRFFLERDQTSHPSEQRRDPQQIVAASCSVLKNLVSDKLAKFRRAQECLVNTESEVPFIHTDQGIDLSELSGILTLDLERREFPFKDSVKRPGFLSLQLSSRVPLLVRDPVAGGNMPKAIESERLVNNDLHIVRVDLQPGEVRQVSYGLDNKDFRETDLAGRMSAVVDPERGVLARLVRALRSKETEARALNGVLSDILRDLPDELQAAPEPDVETARDEEARAARLDTLVGEAQRTLARLLESIEVLAALAAPLVPSLAHALDRVALIAVREVDRLAARCHADYERLLQLWTRTEEERRELVSVIDRMGGKVDGSGGVELRNRVAKLHHDLQQQEQLYSDLLKEKSQQQAVAEEAQRSVLTLRGRVQELQGEVAELQRGKRQLAEESRQYSKALASTKRESAGKALQDQLYNDLEKRTGMSFADARESFREVNPDPEHGALPPHSRAEAIAAALEANPSKSEGSGPDLVEGSRNESKDGGVSQAPAMPAGEPPAKPSGTRGSVGRGSSKGPAQLQEPQKLSRLYNFALTKSTQTETEHIFNDSAPLAEELTNMQYEDTMRTAKRLYAILGRYEWNEVSHKYFLRAEHGDLDSDDDSPLTKRRKSDMPRDDREGVHVKGTMARLMTLQNLKMKVERAHQKANVVQMEEVIQRLEACAKESFEQWITKVCKDLGSSRRGATEVPVKLEELFPAVVELVHTEGMRQRIRELEDHLASLLPLAERARGSEQGGEQGTDSVFWKRVMRLVRQSAMTRKGSAVAGAGASSKNVSLQLQGRRRSSLGGLVVPSMDMARLLAELAAIWGSVVNSSSTGTGKVVGGRLPAQQILQGCIKTFYLRKSGRSKHVEAAVVALCRAVLDFSGKNLKVALFSVMADIQPATAMVGRLPLPKRDIEVQLDPNILHGLPLDAAHAMAALMRELKSLQRSKKYQFAHSTVDTGEAADPILPLQLVLAAFHVVMSSRGRCYNSFLQRLLYGYLEIPHLDFKEVMQLSSSPPSQQGSEAEMSAGARTSSETPPRATSAEGVPRPAGDQRVGSAPGSSRQSQVKGGGSSSSPKPVPENNAESADESCNADAATLNELVYVSHLVAAYVWHSVHTNATGDEREDEKLRLAGITTLWQHILEEGGTSSNIRRSLGLGSASSANAQKVAQLLVKFGVVHLPWQTVARSLLLASGLSDYAAPDAQIVKVMFIRFCEACRNCTTEGGVRCRESLSLWAGLWSLSYERDHEVDLMGTLFSLYDTSGDGWLQFEEFADFIKAVAPTVSRTDAEELFLCGAEEVSGDMTRQVFIQLVLRLGITSNVEHLESLVNTKKASMYGSEAPDGL